MNLGNVIHHKSVKFKIPPYFNDQSVSIISHTHITPIEMKIFNYKNVLLDLNIDYFKFKTPVWTCASFSYIYNPTGHAITGYKQHKKDQNILWISLWIMPDNEQSMKI